MMIHWLLQLAVIPSILISLHSLSCQAFEDGQQSFRDASILRNLRRREGRGEGTKSESSFDFYVLSMSYQPEFCFQHRHEKFAGCENPMDFWKSSLTLHGLWPEVSIS